MICRSETIKGLAEQQGGEPVYRGHQGEGDNRVILWALPKGEELIETNGDAVNPDNDAWSYLRTLATGKHTLGDVAEAIARGQETIYTAAVRTGWHIIDGCLVEKPGTWAADDGNAEIEIETDSAQEAAEEYVEGGEWGERNETGWVTVWTWRYGIDEAGDIVHVDREAHTVTIEAIEPACLKGEEHHEWDDPIEIVGGCKESPGVEGHGGGVRIHEVCMKCGCGKVIDTWAQNPETGEQGLHSVEFTVNQYRDEIEKRREAREAEEEEDKRLRMLVGYGAPPEDRHFREIGPKDLAIILTEIRESEKTATTDWAKDAWDTDMEAATRAANLLNEGKRVFVAQDEDGYYFARQAQ
jgi:hypothetical protein